MEWIQFGIFLATMAGFFLTQRNDINAVRSEAAADRRDILNLIRSIQEEIKDFHGRLCAIEERNKAK